MTRPSAGKYEGNTSLEVSVLLDEICMNGMQDQEIGSVDEIGWFALILRRGRNLPGVAYIVQQDSNGFFSYVEYESTNLSLRDWNTIVEDYYIESEDRQKTKEINRNKYLRRKQVCA